MSYAEEEEAAVTVFEEKNENKDEDGGELVRERGDGRRHRGVEGVGLRSRTRTQEQMEEMERENRERTRETEGRHGTDMDKVEDGEGEVDAEEAEVEPAGMAGDGERTLGEGGVQDTPDGENVRDKGHPRRRRPRRRQGAEVPRVAASRRRGGQRVRVCGREGGDDASGVAGGQTGYH